MDKNLCIMLLEGINIYTIIPILGNNNSLTIKCINGGMLVQHDVMTKVNIIDCVGNSVSMDELNLLIATNELMNKS